MAVILEFWKSKSDHSIRVFYENKSYLFAEFLNLAESKMIVTSIYNEILRNNPKVGVKGSVGEVVGKYIKDHFLGMDIANDVVILGNGKKVIFNLEDPKK